MTPTPALRFYGRSPSDWNEGACGGHLFSIQLERDPSDHELEQLAALLEQALQKGPAEPAIEPWRWSGRFAAFQLGERRSGRGLETFLHAVHDWLLAASAIVPVREAVFHGARGVQLAPEVGRPDPGPDFGRCASPDLQRPIDPALPVPAPREVFERARALVRLELAAAEIAALIEPRKEGQVGMIRCAQDPGPAPEPPPWGGAVLAAFAVAEGVNDVGDHLVGCHGRPLACVAPEPLARTGLAYLDESGRRQEVRFPQQVHYLHPPFDLHPAGDRCLLTVDSVLFEADLREGTARPAFEPPSGESIQEAAYLHDGRVAVGTDKHVWLLAIEGPIPRTLDCAAPGVSRLCAVHDRRVLVTGLLRPRVLAYVGDKLARIGSFATDELWFDREQDGRLIFGAQRGALRYELSHLHEVLAGLGKTATTAETGGKKRTPKVPAVALELRRDARDVPPPGDVPVPPSVQARIEPHQMVVTCHTGRVVFTTGQYINAWGAIVVEPDGAEQDLMALIQSTGEGGQRVALSGLALTDCGTRLFVQPSSHDVYAIDLEATPPTIEAVSQGGVMTHGPIMDMTAAGRDHVFVLGMMQLAWFRRGATGWEQAAAVPVKKGIQVVATTTAEGPAAVAVLSDTKARVQIFALRAGGFTPIGKFAEPVQRLEAWGSHLLVRLAGGRLEVAGLAEALGLQR